ncbi:hypothetical protein D3C86_1998710 [compost metagenome]
MRAAEYRLAQCGRLQQVMPAIADQAATDEGQIGQGIEKQQFAHGVAEQHLIARQQRRATGAPTGGETLALAQLEHRSEALRMSRHQNQQGLGPLLE